MIDEDDLEQVGVEMVPLQEFEAKFSSKRQVWTLLAVDCAMFIPPLDHVSIYFLKHLACGKRKRK